MADAPEPKRGPTDAELLDLQRAVIVELRLEKSELREQAVAALRKATGKPWRECDDLLANAYGPEPASKPGERCKHGKTANQECLECAGGFDNASPMISESQPQSRAFMSAWLQTAANELLRELDREIFGKNIDIFKLPQAVGMVEDFAEAYARAREEHAKPGESMSCRREQARETRSL